MTPPRLPRAILARLLPRGHRASLLAELDEEFARHIATSRSPAAAWRWYWRQVVLSAPAALGLRRRRHQGAPTTLTRSDSSRSIVQPLLADLRFGARLLWRRPGFAAAAMVTLALGITVTSAVLTVAYAVLLRPLPYADPDRLVSLAEVDTRRESAGGNLSYPDFLDYRAQNRTLTSLAGFSGGSRTLTGAGPAERVAIAEVTAEFFGTLGVRPILGRDLGPADTQTGADPVVLLTYGAWVRRFGGDASLVGRTILLNGQPTTVVGVLPSDFAFPPRGLAELWLPVHPSNAQLERRYFHGLDAVGRLRPDVSRSQAADDLSVIAKRFASIDPRYHPAAAARVTSLTNRIVGDVRPTLLVLLTGAICLLLIACTNIGGLLVARSSARLREMDVRLAVGATRRRLIGQLLAESLVLAVPSTAVGFVAGQALVRMFVAALPRAQRAALPAFDNLSLDPVLLAWTAGLAVLSAAVFGLAPAWRLASARERASRGSVGGTRHEGRLQGAFVVVQIALALVLLTGAGLMTQSVRHLLAVSPGFSTDGLLTWRLTLGADKKTDAAARILHRNLLDGLGALAGVSGVATIDQLPLTGPGNSGAFVRQSAPAGPETTTLIRTVSANYFDVMGIPTHAGRGLTDDDRIGRPLVVVVNDRLARTAFDGDAIGQRISFPFITGQPFWDIVGVVADEQFDALDRAIQPVVYFPYEQTPDTAFSMIARTSGDPSALVAQVRSAVAAIDPAMPVYSLATMDQIADTSDAVFRRRSVLALMAVFAAAAVTLAAVGLYGVLAQTVAQRTREIGVRMTLGAQRSRIIYGVFQRAVVPLGLGLAIGLAGSLAFGRSLRSLLFGVAPADAETLVVGFATFVGVGLLACWIPALRATRIDPVEALRRD